MFKLNEEATAAALISNYEQWSVLTPRIAGWRRLSGSPVAAQQLLICLTEWRKQWKSELWLITSFNYSDIFWHILMFSEFRWYSIHFSQDLVGLELCWSTLSLLFRVCLGRQVTARSLRLAGHVADKLSLPSCHGSSWIFSSSAHGSSVTHRYSIFQLL